MKIKIKNPYDSKDAPWICLILVGFLCDVQTGSARDTLITLIDTFVILSRADLHKHSQIKVLC